MKKGITLNQTGDLDVRNGSLHLSDTTFQEVGIILGLNQGEFKFYPVLGPNLMQLVKAKASRITIEKRIKRHLKIDNKDYDELKKHIDLIIKNTL